MSTTDDRPASRMWRELAALALIAAIAAIIYGWTAAAGEKLIGFSDSADYLFLADFYREQFAGAASPATTEFYRTTRFPPLFPIALATFGGGAAELHRAQIAAFVITLGMLAVLWAWLRRCTRSPVSAASITLLMVLSPGLFLLTLDPVSEPLAMGMTWFVFLLASRTTIPTQALLLLALVAGMSTLVRSANIVLVVAIPIWLYLRHANRRQWAAATLAAFSPFALWMLYRRSIPNAGHYWDGLTLEYFVTELGGWPELFYRHPWQLITGVARNLDALPDPLSLSAAIILVGLAAYGGWHRLRSRELDAVFALLYLGLLLIWPYPTEAPRFITFVLPLLFLYALWGVRRALATMRPRWHTEIAASAILASIFLVASAPSLRHFAHLATLDLDDSVRGEQRSQQYFLAWNRDEARKSAEGNHLIRLAARQVAEGVAPGQCVYASLPYLLKMNGFERVLPYPRSIRNDISFESQLRGCDYFFVAGVKGLYPGQESFYPIEQLKPWTSTVFAAEYGENAIVAALLVREAVPLPGDSTSFDASDP